MADLERILSRLSVWLAPKLLAKIVEVIEVMSRWTGKEKVEKEEEEKEKDERNKKEESEKSDCKKEVEEKETLEETSMDMEDNEEEMKKEEEQDELENEMEEEGENKKDKEQEKEKGEKKKEQRSNRTAQRYDRLTARSLRREERYARVTDQSLSTKIKGLLKRLLRLPAKLQGEELLRFLGRSFTSTSKKHTVLAFLFFFVRDSVEWFKSRQTSFLPCGF